MMINDTDVGTQGNQMTTIRDTLTDSIDNGYVINSNVTCEGVSSNPLERNLNRNKFKHTRISYNAQTIRCLIFNGTEFITVQNENSNLHNQWDRPNLSEIDF